MNPEWTDRLAHWIQTLRQEFYEPLGEITLEGMTTMDMLSPQEAERGAFAPMPAGTPWGRTWEYAWFRGEIALTPEASGQTIVMDIRTGGEATLFVDGEAFGTRRAEWVGEAHHYLCDQVLTRCARGDERFHLLLEAYAGHDYPESPLGGCATGPVRPGDYAPRDESEPRQRVGRTTWGIWHEEAYQLWLDVTTLRDTLASVDPASLRAAKIEEALEAFMLGVDFEQERPARLADYARARKLLAPALAARNGSTAPAFYAVGNAHLDICWLWPYRETQRKVARTFAQQIRLMELYPEYRFLQSQPQAYLVCKELYPALYARIREKARTGQWIADGSMWVEPDTNMTSGESLIRQIVHGKRFYREEFGVDCELLWLPDTFGYSAVLPQILRGCGVKYLTTQKIFWTYNGSDRFPYHYFTWVGMDGSEVTSFLHMDYTSRTDPATVAGRWRDRVQRRDLTRFLLPFGYGDGGGGPTRDDIEYIRREADLEGIPRVRIESPVRLFEDCAAEGAPKNRYVGELYFQCHRGTYTTQAAIKRGNRKSELALREAELWCAAAGEYPLAQLDRCWKDVLFNQFHDILPGSSIARVYEEARAKYDAVLRETDGMIRGALARFTAGEGETWFSSLPWTRRALVRTQEGYAFADIPPCGATSRVDRTLPDSPVTARMDGADVVMENGLLRIRLNERGEMTECTDAAGRARISAPGNVLRLYKDVPRKFDAWDIDSMVEASPAPMDGESRIELIECTPFVCRARVTRSFSHSQLEQVISLTAGRAQVDFETTVVWHERHRLLKAAFPTGIHAEEGINEIQFGYVRRPTHRSRPYDADRFEVCNHRYTALCDEGSGAAVLNDCKYGVSMLGDEIALTLLRAATCPDLHADQGEHRFTYSYYVWDGPLLTSGVVQAGYELNVDVQHAQGRCEDFSLASCDRGNVIIETIKQAEDGSGDVILRVYESLNAACHARLTLGLPATSALECDMLERELRPLELQNGQLELDFRGFEIKTLRLKR
ncbi:MAG: glycoside hydrolase family 38 C-terminal domain-containing protein [Clostridiales bacterium]|nr:glycoside hydrolase family 38 C-terminal domain-containing protein [Clostridiales bacterium]MDY5515622.1 glycoside hydrolase family 38 C-terminal domain-containing protein [Candidatus Ventricola sp.]